MISHQKALLKLLLSVVGTFLLIGIMNYFLDTRGIFRTDFSKQVIEPNKHFIKMRYLIKNPDLHDSFLFGSSRVGAIDVNKIENGNWYNMTYSEGLPDEYYNDLLLLIENGVRIKHVMIGLDDFSYKVDPKKHYNELSRYPYTNNNLKFYLKYLFTIPDIIVVEPYLKNIRTDTLLKLPYNGSVDYSSKEKEIEENIEAHINNSKFSKPNHYEGNRIEETLNTIEKIIVLSKKENFDIKFFINPIHVTTYLDSSITKFDYFKNRLSLLTDFYDFSGFNSVTINNYYYYETSHYRPIVGDFILSSIYEKSYAPVPPDFGSYRNQNSVRKESTINGEIPYELINDSWKAKKDVVMTLDKNKIDLKSTGNDPYIESNTKLDLSNKSNRYFLKIEMHSNASDNGNYLQVFYKIDDQKYSEENSMKNNITSGLSTYYFALPNAKNLYLRIDPFVGFGESTIKSMEIFSIFIKK